MKALQLEKSTKVEDLELSEVKIPEIKSGWVLVKVMAFGLNHSEVMFRQFEIDNPKFEKPRIIGIECVGLVENGSDTDLEKGEKVVALMGGMGRTFDGSYAEYALLPRKNIFRVKTELDWAHLAAVPETYFTAWGSLFDCLQLKSSDTLLIRAGASALGIASTLIAKGVGARVISTVRDDGRNDLLEEIGVDRIVIDPDGSLEEIGFDEKVDKVLDLIGAATAKDSLKVLNFGGIVCSTGTLGGKFRVDINPINDIPNGCYLTGFYSNYPTQEVVDTLFAFIDEQKITPKNGKTYQFEDVKTYSKDLEDGTTGGKGVVLVGARG